MPLKNTLQLVTTGANYYPDLRIPLVVEKNRTAVPEKVDDRLQAVLIESGTGMIHFKKKAISILPPMLLLLREKETCLFENPVQLNMHVIYFHPDVINSDFSLQNIYDPEYPFSETARQDRFILKPVIQQSIEKRIIAVNPISIHHLRNHFFAIQNDLYYQKDRMWPCTVRGTLIQLLFLVCHISENALPELRTPDSDKKNTIDEISPEKQLVEKAMLFLYSNYSEKMNIEDIAQAINTNRTTLANCFKRQMNMTLLAYLTKLRMDIAASLLHNTHLSVNGIMVKVGFQDVTHFGRIFKKHFAISPAEYRKQNIKMLY